MAENIFNLFGVTSSIEEPKKIILTKSEFYKNLKNYTLDEILKLYNPDTDSCLLTKLEMLHALLKYKEKEGYVLTIEQLNKKLKKNVSTTLYKKIMEYNTVMYDPIEQSNSGVAKINKNITFNNFYKVVKKNNSYFIPVVKYGYKVKFNIKNNTNLIKNYNQNKMKPKYEKILIDELYNIIVHYDILHFINNGNTQEAEIYKEREHYTDINRIYIKIDNTIYFVELINCIKIENTKTIAWPWIYKNNKNNNFYYNPLTNKKTQTKPNEENYIYIREIIDKIYELLKNKCITLYNLINKYKYINYLENQQNVRSEIIHLDKNEIEYRYFIFYNYEEKKFTIPVQDNNNFKRICLCKSISFQSNNTKNTKNIINKNKLFFLTSFNDSNCNITNNESEYSNNSNNNTSTTSTNNNYYSHNQTSTTSTTSTNNNYYSHNQTKNTKLLPKNTTKPIITPIMSSNNLSKLFQKTNNPLPTLYPNEKNISTLIDDLIKNPNDYENIIINFTKKLSAQNIFKIIYEINKSEIEENIKDDIIRHLMIKSSINKYNSSESYYSYYIDLLIDDLIKNPNDYANIINKFKILIESNKISNQDLIDRIINILGFKQYTDKISLNDKNKLISNLKKIVPNFRNFKQLEYIKTTTGLGSIFGKRKKNTVQI